MSTNEVRRFLEEQLDQGIYGQGSGLEYQSMFKKEFFLRGVGTSWDFDRLLDCCADHLNDNGDICYPRAIDDSGGDEIVTGKQRKIPPAPLTDKGKLRFIEIVKTPDQVRGDTVLTREQRRVRRGILNSLGKSGRGNHTLASYAAYTDFYKLEKEEDHDEKAV
ncbi:MAG TPA: hypothetical protein PKJ37_12560 [Acidobacteriota bacterium]|nr:hypothetical protein [Acidobacteriota bacterium]